MARSAGEDGAAGFRRSSAPINAGIGCCVHGGGSDCDGGDNFGSVVFVLSS